MYRLPGVYRFFFISKFHFYLKTLFTQTLFFVFPLPLVLFFSHLHFWSLSVCTHAQTAAPPLIFLFLASYLLCCHFLISNMCNVSQHFSTYDQNENTTYCWGLLDGQCTESSTLQTPCKRQSSVDIVCLVRGVVRGCV